MRKHILTTALAALVASATMASAATLSLVGDLQVQEVKKNDIKNLPVTINGTQLQFISGDRKTVSNGLSLSGPARVTYTYLGFEAGNTNYALTMGTGAVSFANKGTGTSSVGDATTIFQAGGLLNFAFGTSAPASSVSLFKNAGTADPASANYAVGYRRLSDTSFLAFFDDIAGGDRDFDDLAVRIDVAAVPLPAGGLLLVGGLAGLAAFKRRRKAA